MPARASRDDFAPIIIAAIRAKKQANAKQIRYTAKYPTATEQSAVISPGTKYDEVAVEFAQNGTFFNQSCRPGANAMPEMIAPTSSIIAYINRVDVEFRHDGHAAQHNEQAVPVQQQASYNNQTQNENELSFHYNNESYCMTYK